MAEILQDKKKLTVNIVIALCYAIFTFLIVLRHELWADEAQVWLLVKNMNPAVLFNYLGVEGHPPLFYLLIMPFVKLNFSAFSMQILCWLFSVLGVFLLFQFSPFKWWLNASVVLSAGFLYVFPVIARSYSLIPFLVFLSALLYRKRKEYPIYYALSLFLISMTHFIMLGFVSVLLLCFVVEILREKRINLKNILSAFLVVFGILFVLFLSLFSIGNNDFITPSTQLFIIPFILRFFATAFVYDVSSARIISVLLYSLLFFVLLFNLLKFSKKGFFICFVSVAAQFAIYILFYPSLIYTTRVFCMYVLLIFAYWIVWEDCSAEKVKRITSVLLSVFLLMTSLNGFKLIKNDYFGAYSASKETAEFIKGHINPETDIILTDIVQNHLGTVVYLDDKNKIYYAPTKEPIKYSVWKAKLNNYFQPVDWNKYLPAFDTDKNVYVILPYTGGISEIDNTEVIFVSEDSIAKNEKFYILKYEGNK